MQTLYLVEGLTSFLGYNQHNTWDTAPISGLHILSVHLFVGNILLILLILFQIVCQWRWSTNIQFKVKLISICFYILCFTGFTGTYIWAHGKLPLLFLLADFGLCLSKYNYIIIILLFERDVKLSCNIQFLYKLKHIIYSALLEVLSILNILYGFTSFIFPGYYFPQKLCQQSLWWLPNQLKP